MISYVKYALDDREVENASFSTTLSDTQLGAKDGYFGRLYRNTTFYIDPRGTALDAKL